MRITKVMHQPAPHQLYVKPSITVKDQKLPAIDKFMYLSSILSEAVHIHDEFSSRIAKASVNFRRLDATVWE